MRRLLAVLSLALCGLACYDDVDCTPTRTVATAANKIDLSQPTGSAVLRARLTVRNNDKPLPGLTVTVEVLDDGAAVYTDEATTNGRGAAAVDLKGKLDPNVIQALARGDAWRASFAGDATYCSSQDQAPFRLLSG